MAMMGIEYSTRSLFCNTVTDPSATTTDASRSRRLSPSATTALASNFKGVVSSGRDGAGLGPLLAGRGVGSGVVGKDGGVVAEGSGAVLIGGSEISIGGGAAGGGVDGVVDGSEAGVVVAVCGPSLGVAFDPGRRKAMTARTTTPMTSPASTTPTMANCLRGMTSVVPPLVV